MTGFGEIRQLGHIVTDMDQALEFWTSRLQVGPFFLMREVAFENYSYRGQEMPSPHLAIAIAFSGSVQIELIQQLDDTPSTYAEFLSAGRTGLHHYSTWFSRREDYERTRSWALSANFALVSECRPADSSRLAYFETANPAAPLFELSEALVPGVAEMMDLVETTCRDWDGSDPVRTIPRFETAED